AQKLIIPDNGQQVHVSINLSKANAIVGSQGILQSVFNLSTGNGAWYQCADIKVTGDTQPSANSARSIQNYTAPCGSFNDVNTSRITEFP
ncbi:18057_t:CDS:2, partial [Gigaspora margarita]